MAGASRFSSTLKVRQLTLKHSVSYVRGFSVSIVCQCAQSDNSTRISGCNKDLWTATGKACENPGGQTNVTCPNTAGAKGPAEQWFAPCTHLAYTYREYSFLVIVLLKVVGTVLYGYCFQGSMAGKLT